MAEHRLTGKKSSWSIWWFVGLGLLLRLMIDTSSQLFYPFVPVLAAGLGVTAITMGRLIGLQAIVGLVAPVFGHLADRLGYRKFVWLGLLLAGGGMLLFGASPNLSVAAVACVVIGFGFSLFTPNLLAYQSANLPDARRSRGMGAVELSWGLAGFVGVATIGAAIGRWGWRSPLMGLGGIMMAASFIALIFPPTQRPESRVKTLPSEKLPLGRRLRSFFDLGPGKAAAWAAIAATGLTSFASSHLISSYGQWLSVEYGFAAEALGRVAGIIGLGGLSAILLISAFGDRIGSLRGAKIGAFFGAFTYLALPLINISSTVLIVGLFVLYFFYQYAIVNGIILTSAMIPGQRGKMMTLGWALDTIGITLANLTGPPAFATFGPWGLAIPSAVTMFVLWVILRRWGLNGPV